MAQGDWPKTLVVLMLLSYLRDTHEASVHRLCGLHLVEALLLVCEGRGFYYRPQKGFNVHTSRLGTFIERTSQMNHKKLGIVEKCCYRSCTYYDLEHYCNR
ncbi:hypothetical protein XENTR_v10019299 [Xenopus tropicalis]|nr:hypothetical protein XENTR_v10019299 [Xenopus tropicalis]KAE8593753.1 hypothetical protein XENTR_v10019299 [Xenopus tropicalis]KAE8593754.1 hypothetical protein XENTR_v10019299 [Xenopus tropicalis]KAE8593755.1 hypothetical protein XENTR_v10019299 [Xenopus tropicalis]